MNESDGSLDIKAGLISFQTVGDKLSFLDRQMWASSQSIEDARRCLRIGPVDSDRSLVVLLDQLVHLAVS